jgi:hypothetical protein
MNNSAWRFSHEARDTKKICARAVRWWSGSKLGIWKPVKYEDMAQRGL